MHRVVYRLECYSVVLYILRYVSISKFYAQFRYSQTNRKTRSELLFHVSLCCFYSCFYSYILLFFCMPYLFNLCIIFFSERSSNIEMFSFCVYMILILIHCTLLNLILIYPLRYFKKSWFLLPAMKIKLVRYYVRVNTSIPGYCICLLAKHYREVINCTTFLFFEHSIS